MENVRELDATELRSARTSIVSISSNAYTTCAQHNGSGRKMSQWSTVGVDKTRCNDVEVWISDD